MHFFSSVGGHAHGPPGVRWLPLVNIYQVYISLEKLICAGRIRTVMHTNAPSVLSFRPRRHDRFVAERDRIVEPIHADLQ